MKRGCIAISAIKCDLCGANIEHGDRYLIIDSADRVNKKRVCTNCCLKKKYAKYFTEKGEKTLSFLVDNAEVKSKKKTKE